MSVIVLGSGVAGAQDAGELIFNNTCRTCHTVKEGDNRLGPSLAGVVGRKAGSLPGYPYSDAMKKSGVTWDEATLERFIENPDAVVRGNGMKPFTGVASVDDRSKIIAYLKAQGGTAQ
jgi:cytochrome c